MITAEERNRYIRLSYIGFALLFAIFYDFFFWKQELGLGFLLFVILYSIGFLIVAFFTRQLHQPFALLLLIPIFIMSSNVMLYNNNLVQHFIPFFVFVLLIVFSMLIPLRNPNKLSVSLLQIPIVRNVFLFFDQWGKVYRDLFRGKTKESKRSEVYKKIAIGIIIAIPILYIFGALFASADPAFGKTLEHFFERFFNLHIDLTTVWRTIRTIFLTLFVSSFLYLLLSEEHSLLGERVSKPRKIDSIISGTILTLVNALFLFFLIVQLQTLQNAEYARSGFFQLTWVVTLTALMLIVFYRSLAHYGGGRWLKLLMGFSIIQVALIASFAVYRMSLFQDLGYSVTRLYVEWFIYFVLTLLLLALVSIILKKPFYFFFYTSLVTGIVALTIVSSVNVDKMVGYENYLRAFDGGSHLDYFLPLSVDAMEALASTASNKNIVIADQVTTILGLRYDYIRKHDSWKEWNLGVERARQFLPK